MEWWAKKELILATEVGQSDPKFLAVFGHRPAGKFYIFFREQIDNLTVAQWFFRILLLDDGSNDFLHTGIGNGAPILAGISRVKKYL